MELRQLIYFDAVARHGHFTKAAQQLHIAQPAVSAQIRRLERELGTDLFQRTTRTVRLTPAGELLQAHVRRVLDELAAARAAVDQLSGLVRGRVLLGAVQSLEPLDLPGFLAGFHRRCPAVEIGLRSGTTNDMLGGLRAGELDLAVAPLPGEPPAGFAGSPLFTEELVIAFPPGHELATGAPVRFSALREEPFVSLPEDSGLRATLTEAAGSAGFVPRVPFEARDYRRIAELVRHGLGVALMPRSSAGDVTASLDPPLTRTVWLIRRKG
ncbi:MAG TPA: LysR family transcriptional regulator, partial [Amycolatopsis sp.]|nr:LysR family transcriptional regulator [Amycolatopsis sp.]